MTLRHYLIESDLSADEFRQLIKRAQELKSLTQQGDSYTPLTARTLAMIFEKSSTRTRVSFETGMTQMGGHAIYLSPCLLYTSPSPRDKRQSRMPSSA